MVGLGKVAISKDLSISNVLLVESVSFNLLSIAQLCDLGLICTFSDSGVVVISKEDKSLIIKGFRHGNIYLVDFPLTMLVWLLVYFQRTLWDGFGIDGLLTLG